MKQTRQRSGEWVIACDGRKAMILENVGDDKRNLRSDPPTHVQSRDRQRLCEDADSRNREDVYGLAPMRATPHRSLRNCLQPTFRNNNRPCGSSCPET